MRDDHGGKNIKKIYDIKKRKKKLDFGSQSNEIKTAFQNEEELKNKNKRLTINWFFRPEND